MKLEKIGQLVGGCSIGYGGEKEFLILFWKTISRSRVDCKLVRVVDDCKNEDAFAWQ